jgi:hypothetical protein
VPDDRQKHRPWGEHGRTDPDSLRPGDEEAAAGPGGASADIVLRALSVLPFLLVAAIGLIAIVSWVLIIVLGAGSAEPIWDAVAGMSGGELVWQLLLAVLIGAAALLVTVLGSWATAHGFQEDSGRPFWIMTQGVWGLVAVGLVYVERTWDTSLRDLGLSGLEWWFGLGVVAFAMILAGVRLRRAPRYDEDD